MTAFGNVDQRLPSEPLMVMVYDVAEYGATFGAIVLGRLSL
jgi:hypothetical protein